MLITIASGKAAPGATTATWGLSIGWHQPALAIDADPAGGDMAAGLLLGRAQLDRGLLSWSTATRRASASEAAAMMGEHSLALPEAPHLWLMPGLQHAAQASALEAGGWDRLAQALTAAGATTGRDVLVDAGRLGDRTGWPVIAASEQIVLVCRRSGRSIHAARNAATLLQMRRGDLYAVSLLVVDGSGPYDPISIARELGVPLLGVLPFDPSTAAVLSDGSAAGVRGLTRTRLVKAAKPIALQLLPSTATRLAVASAVSP